MPKMYLPALLLILCPPVAAAELFDDLPTQPTYTLRDLNLLEPASGHAEAAPAEEVGAHGASAEGGEAAAEGHAAPGEAQGAAEEGKPEAEGEHGAAEGDHGAAEGGHGAPEAEGEGHSKKKSNIKPKETLPLVTIGGKPVITRTEQLAKDVSETTPTGLRQRGMDQLLNHRVNIVPYAHNPVEGDASAPIQVVVFEDIGCVPCMAAMGSIDTALAPYASQTQIVHVHTPAVRFQDTNLPAFYGRIAARMGLYLPFRKALMASQKVEQKDLFDQLVQLNLSGRTIRQLMMNESRRFYRELDADALMARTYAIGKPPVVFVNGIRVGEGGLDLAKLADVLSYVSARHQRGLEEGP